jgi:UPF0755 protein
MKKKFVLVVFILGLVGCYVIYKKFFASTTQFTSKYKIIYIPSNSADEKTLLKLLDKDSIIKSNSDFNWLAEKMNYLQNIRPGRYKILANTNTINLVRQLRSGNQFGANLVINKLRLPEDLAKVMSRAIETDSATIAQLLTNKDSLAKFGLTSENLMAYIIPNTYEVFWTWTPERVLEKLMKDRERWWDADERKEKAEKSGLSLDEVHTIASIVEEETNKKADRPLVASVYLNRIKLGMPLQADPTVRFAMKDFVSNRVLYTHLRTPSPYNTYLNRGLPPGPICTPSQAALEAVLNAPKTDYIFFVANANLEGGSTFTTNFADHSRAARVYQDSLSAWLKRKAVKEKALKDSIAKANQKTS